MSAHLTREPVVVETIRWQADRLGYALCGEHIDGARGGDLDEREARDILRSAETDDRDLWICGVCGRHVTDWPRTMATMYATIEHTTCRIF